MTSTEAAQAQTHDLRTRQRAFLQSAPLLTVWYECFAKQSTSLARLAELGNLLEILHIEVVSPNATDPPERAVRFFDRDVYPERTGSHSTLLFYTASRMSSPKHIRRTRSRRSLYQWY